MNVRGLIGHEMLIIEAGCLMDEELLSFIFLHMFDIFLDKG